MLLLLASNNNDISELLVFEIKWLIGRIILGFAESADIELFPGYDICSQLRKIYQIQQDEHEIVSMIFQEQLNLVLFFLVSFFSLSVYGFPGAVQLDKIELLRWTILQNGDTYRVFGIPI